MPNQNQVADLFTSVEELERRLLVLTAKHTSLWSIKPEGQPEIMMWQVQLAEISREIITTMRRLHELTGDDQYKV